MIDRAQQARGLSLRQHLPDAVFSSGDVYVSSCCADSRHCRPGDLFVALTGKSDSDHDRVAEAIQRGAAAVLADRPIAACAIPADPVSSDPISGDTVPLCLVEDAREAYGRLCQALAGYPAKKLKLVAVAGRYGKTTTSYLTAAVLAAAGMRSGVLGALGYFDGDTWQNARWTTPPPPLMARWMARIAAGGCTHAVVEVSSRGLERQRVAGLDFDVACVTKVHRRAPGSHGSIHKNRKVTLFDHLLPEGFAVVNVDDPRAERLLARLDGPVLTVGVNGAAEVTALPLEQLPSEQTFLLSVGGETIPVRTALIGNQNIYNCLLATAVGLAYSIDLPTIVQGLEAIQRVPGTLERLECGQPFAVYVDRAHTAGALASCLETLRAVTSGRLICVVGASGDRDKSKHRRLRRAAEAAADLAAVCGDDRRETIAWALGQAQPGDCVLIAGGGRETIQQIGGKQDQFDDRQVARQWLYESLSPERLYRASA